MMLTQREELAVRALYNLCSAVIASPTSIAKEEPVADAIDMALIVAAHLRGMVLKGLSEEEALARLSSLRDKAPK